MTQYPPTRECDRVNSSEHIWWHSSPFGSLEAHLKRPRPMQFNQFQPFLYSSQNVIQEGAGMLVHVINIIVLVLIPMVIIHVNGASFSLSENFRFSHCLPHSHHSTFTFSRRKCCLFPLFNIVHETLELHSSEFVVPKRFEGAANKSTQSLEEYFNCRIT